MIFLICLTRISASSGCSSTQVARDGFVPDIVPLSSQRENAPAHAGVFSYRKKTGQDLDDGRAERFLDAYAEVGMCILHGIREKQGREVKMALKSEPGTLMFVSYGHE